MFLDPILRVESKDWMVKSLISPVVVVVVEIYHPSLNHPYWMEIEMILVYSRMMR